MAEHPGSAAHRIQRRLLNGFRTALLVVAVVVQFVLSFVPGARPAETLGSWPEIAAFLLLAAVAVVGVRHTLRGRSPVPTTRWAGVVVLLACSVLVSAALPADPVVRVEHWCFGVVGWYGLYLLFDVRLVFIALFLGAHVVLTVGQVVVSGAPGSQWAPMVTSAISVVGFQFGVATAAVAFRRIASFAAASSPAREETQTREIIAELTRRDRELHHSRLLVTTVPLLTGLATGALDPATEDTRRRCAVEAVRMRRLFAESDDSSDPLMHELRAVIDIADRHGVSVQLAVRGQPQELPTPVRHELLEPISEVLAVTGSTARVTVVRSPGRVRVSVVADATGWCPTGTVPQQVRLTTEQRGSSLWMEAMWESPIRSPSR